MVPQVMLVEVIIVLQAEQAVLQDQQVQQVLLEMREQVN